MLNWGIVSTGGIAHKVAQVLTPAHTQGMGKMQAVFSRSMRRASSFAKQYNIPSAYSQLDDMLADSAVQAVYIANPHPFHLETVLKAAEAKKHILCEKPLGMNRAQTEQMVKAARKHKVFLTEAFTYRTSAQTQKLRSLLLEGYIGRPLHMDCSLVTHLENPPLRLTEKNLGGGAILDLGCYTISMARMIGGLSSGGMYAEPEILAATSFFQKNGADEFSTAFLRFETGMTAALACGFRAQQTNRLSIIGTTGRIDIENPWFSRERLRIMRAKTNAEEIFDFSKDTTERFGMLFARIGQCVAEGRLELQETTWKDSLGNASALDAWRAAVGLRYEADK